MDFKICRICGDNKNLKAISEQDTEMVNKLLVCANINISPGNILPKLICIECDKNVDVCYRLRKQSEATQSRIMLEIQKIKNYAANTEEENVPCVDRVLEHSDCEKIDLSQCSDNSFEIIKAATNFGKMSFDYKTDEKQIESKYEDIFKQGDEVTELLESDHVDCEENSNAYCIRSDLCTTEISFDNTLNELAESKPCSVDLLSFSGSSTNECDELNSEQFKTKLSSLTCDTCFEVFTTNKDYRIHIKQHGLERYQCIQCCKFFRYRSRLKQHEKIHKETSYKCSYCNQNYRALHNLKRHIKSAHLGKKCLECNICNISFSRMDVLKRHLQLHSNEKNFTCSICSQSFKAKDYLFAHHKTHTSNSCASETSRRTRKASATKNLCNYCGKLFKSSFVYKNHLLTHTNEKPYTCDSCSKKFRTIAALTTHQRIHDDYRPYQCDLCLKSFRQTSHLKEHKNVHLDNVPKHICTICQASFAKKSNLKVHLLTHAKEKPFKCADCSAEFSFMHLLQRHASQIHNRSVHKIYTLNDFDETESIVNNNEDLETEMYHYINTVADDDDDDTGKDLANYQDLTGCGEESLEALSPELEVIDELQTRKNTFYENNGAVLEGDPTVDYDKLHTIEDDLEQFNEPENHIEDKKVEVLVTEETEMTGAIYI